MNRRYVHCPIPIPTMAEVVLLALLGLSLFRGGCDWRIPWPDPTPPPAPAPVDPVETGPLWVSYVVPPDASPAAASLRTSATLRETLAGLDCQWRTYTSTEEDVARLNLDGVASEVGLPVVIIQRQTGEIVARLPSPTEVSVSEAVRKLRGK